MKFLVNLFVCLCAVTIFSCSENPVAGDGAGVVTTNGIAGVIKTDDGSVAANTNIRVRSKDYLSDVSSFAKSSAKTYDTKTDENGYFQIRSQDTLMKVGEYFIEAYQGDSLMDFMAVHLESHDTIKEVNGTLEFPSLVSGKVSRKILNGSGAWVQVYGLERIVLVDTSGKFNVPLPAGNFTFRVLNVDSEVDAEDVDSVFAVSGDTTNIGVVYPGYRRPEFPSLTGYAFRNTGFTSSAAVVRLIPFGFNPVSDSLPDYFLTDTDQYGGYLFHGLDNGLYRVEVRHLKQGVFATVDSIAITGTENSAPSCTLSTPGSIQVSFTAGLTETAGYIYLPGTGVFIQYDNDDYAAGYVILPWVPAGNYTSLYYAKNKSLEGNVLIGENIVVGPGKTTVLD
ncbi:MAG: hypothetical protein HQK83_19040 [Fibrobacteria bacterium]|nr:hypothetical protein [Fibrobacteria bacterium]